MSTRSSRASVGEYFNRAGLYKISIWQVRRPFRRRYEFDCDTCELRSTTYPTSDEAWRVARVHADLHTVLIQHQLRRLVPEIS